MKNLTKAAAVALATLTLSACVESQKMTQSEPAMRDASSNAESACMVAINGNYGGEVDDLQVVSSEFSQANSDVVVDAVGVRGGPTTERWHCLVSNDGSQVEDLRVIDSH